MAKKIDEEMARSFVNQAHHMAGNTAIIVTMRAGMPETAYGYVPTVVEMVLHGNRIASWCPELGSFYTTLAGYNTATTKARLNALIYEMGRVVNIPIRNWYSQKKGQVYWGTEPVEDLYSLQWHALPPVGKTHPGCTPYVPEKLRDTPPVLTPPYKPSYEKNMEVLL